MKATLLSALVGSLVVAACSSSNSAAPPITGPTGTPDAAAPATTEAGVAVDAGADTGVDIAPPPAGQGIQYEMQTTIAAGLEDERCKFVVAPPGGMSINNEEVRYTPGSHHFILWSTSYKTIPTKDDNGNTPKDENGKAVVPSTGDVFECSNGPQAGWSTTYFTAGSQSTNGAPMIANLPAGVAIHVPAGTILMMDLHVLNATAASIPTTVKINLYTVDASTVTTEAGTYLFYNPFIEVPAHAAAKARMACPVTSDVTLVNAQSHMHARGLGGFADLEDTNRSVLDQFYVSHDWVNVPVDAYTSPKLALKKGQWIDYTCNYQSTQDTTVYQGLKTTDEMCVFAGVYYPRDTKFETCSKEGTWEGQADNATYIGTGTTTCETALLCISTAPNTLEGLTPCIVDSCPAAGVPLTAVLNCEQAALGGTCASACNSGGSTCISCIETACGPEISACTASTCN